MQVSKCRVVIPRNDIGLGLIELVLSDLDSLLEVVIEPFGIDDRVARAVVPPSVPQSLRCLQIISLNPILFRSRIGFVLRAKVVLLPTNVLGSASGKSGMPG